MAWKLGQPCILLTSLPFIDYAAFSQLCPFVTMPSMRRMRFFGVIVFCVVFYVLYLTSNARHTGSPDFYSKTKEALDRDRGPHHPHAPNKGIAIDNDDEAVALDLANLLKEAEQAAKDNANVKSPKPEGMDAMADKAKPVVQDVTKDKAKADKTEEVLEKDESTKDYDVEREMNRLLKRSPSKSIATKAISL
jgi:hypothetical protein